MADQQVTTREIPWESIVVAADPEFYQRRDYGYVFSSGAKKESKAEDTLYRVEVEA